MAAATILEAVFILPGSLLRGNLIILSTYLLILKTYISNNFIFYLLLQLGAFQVDWLVYHSKQK